MTEFSTYLLKTNYTAATATVDDAAAVAAPPLLACAEQWFGSYAANGVQYVVRAKPLFSASEERRSIHGSSIINGGVAAV